jgi:hypothetical protein
MTMSIRANSVAALGIIAALIASACVDGDITPRPELTGGVSSTGGTTSPATSCVISGTPYSSGDANPAKPCQSCQPGISVSAWTSVADGTPCLTNKVCDTGPAWASAG